MAQFYGGAQAFGAQVSRAGGEWSEHAAGGRVRKVYAASVGSFVQTSDRNGRQRLVMGLPSLVEAKKTTDAHKMGWSIMKCFDWFKYISDR